MLDILTNIIKAQIKLEFILSVDEMHLLHIEGVDMVWRFNSFNWKSDGSRFVDVFYNTGFCFELGLIPGFAYDFEK